MRIVFYKDNLSTGRGADHLICAQAEGLSSLGHDVTVMTCPTDRPFTFPVADTVRVSYVPREAARDFSAGFDVRAYAGSARIFQVEAVCPQYAHKPGFQPVACAADTLRVL